MTPTLEEALPIARAYLRQASALDQNALREKQDAPWTNIAFGAAGIAYALWRAEGPGRGKRLEQADRIVREAAAAAPKDRWPEGAARKRGLGPGLYYGAAGIGAVRALVAHARHDEATTRRELSAFSAICRRASRADSELMIGVAGLLNGVRVLHMVTKDRALLAIGDALSESLDRRALGEAAGAGGFAHGAAGALHASLAWAHHTRRAPTREALRALEDHVKRARKASAPTRDLPPFMQRSWCNGSAGHVLLWVKAYECTGEDVYRTLARASARKTLTALRHAGADLCCGLGGRAYALLAMDRVDPGNGWDARARAMGLRAMRAIADDCGPWPNGLLKGYPGLVCLLGDLGAPRERRRGFPLVEG